MRFVSSCDFGDGRELGIQWSDVMLAADRAAVPQPSRVRCLGGGLKTVMPFFKQLDLRSLSVFLDPKGKTMKSFGVQGLPTSFVIDHRGRIAGELVGPAEWDTDEAKELMRYYIERIGNKIDKTDAADLRADRAGAKQQFEPVHPPKISRELQTD